MSSNSMQTDQAGGAGRALHSNGSRPRRGGCGSAAFVDVAQVVGLLGLRAGARVLDLGAGHGDWVPALARRVGQAGSVLALERDPAALAHLRQMTANWPQLKVQAHDLAVVKPLEVAPAHAALMALVLHHLDPGARAPALAALHGSLLPGARLVLVEFKPVAPPPGPPRRVRLPPGEVRDLAAASGWHWRSMHSVAAHVCCHCLERP